MVALRGSGWVLAPSLVTLVMEADRLAPDRSRVSDGSIGDSAHRTRVSSHNPQDGYVDAVDLTHDPDGGFDAHALARKVAARRDPRIAHLISNRQIWTPATGWRPYTGVNPHDKHAHFDVHRDDTGRDDQSPWFTATKPQETPDMTPDENAALSRIDTRTKESEIRQEQILARLDGLQAGGGSVDLDALAAKVADVIAERLRS